jgi:hypothetical protein
MPRVPDDHVAICGRSGYAFRRGSCRTSRCCVSADRPRTESNELMSAITRRHAQSLDTASDQDRRTPADNCGHSPARRSRPLQHQITRLTALFSEDHEADWGSWTNERSPTKARTARVVCRRLGRGLVVLVGRRAEGRSCVRSARPQGVGPVHRLGRSDEHGHGRILPRRAPGAASGRRRRASRLSDPPPGG